MMVTMENSLMIKLIFVLLPSVLTRVRGHGSNQREKSTLAPGVIVTQGLLNEVYFPELAPKTEHGYNWLSMDNQFGSHRFHCELKEKCSLVEAADKTRVKCQVFSSNSLENTKTKSVMCDAAFGVKKVLTVTRTDVKELSTLCLPRKGMIKNYGAVRMGPIKASLAECAEEMYRTRDSAVGVTWVMTEESVKLKERDPDSIRGNCLFFYPKLHQNLDLLTGKIENTYSCVLRCNRSYRRELTKVDGTVESKSVTECVKKVSGMKAYSAVSFEPATHGGYKCSYGKNFEFKYSKAIGIGGCPLPKPSKRVELITKIIIDSNLRRLTQEEMVKFKLAQPTPKPEVPDTQIVVRQPVPEIEPVDKVVPEASLVPETPQVPEPPQVIQNIDLPADGSAPNNAENTEKSEEKKPEASGGSRTLMYSIGGGVAGLVLLCVGGYCCVKKKEKTAENYDPYGDEYDMSY